MYIEKSLEDEILNAFYDCYYPLSIQEASEQLQARGLTVPLPYLTKVIHILTEAGYLKKVSHQAEPEEYRSSHFIDRFVHPAICLDPEGECEPPAEGEKNARH